MSAEPSHLSSSQLHFPAPRLKKTKTWIPMNIYHQQFLKCVRNPLLIQLSFHSILFEHLTWSTLFALVLSDTLPSSDKTPGCGAPGNLSWLKDCLWVVMISGWLRSWDWALTLAPCSAGISASLSFCSPPPTHQLCSLSLSHACSLSNK